MCDKKFTRPDKNYWNGMGYSSSSDFSTMQFALSAWERKPAQCPDPKTFRRRELKKDDLCKHRYQLAAKDGNIVLLKGGPKDFQAKEYLPNQFCLTKTSAEICMRVEKKEKMG